ncbi:permease, partial [Streptococcus suis]
SDKTSWQKVGFALIQAIDEFIDTGRYLVFGCLFASLVQVYIPTAVLTTIGHSPLTAILLIMLLAFLLSLCSDSDA